MQPLVIIEKEKKDQICEAWRKINQQKTLTEEVLKKLCKDYGIEILREVFREQSIIANILLKNSGSFEMLKIVYTNKKLESVIDKYLLASLSAQALRHRLEAIIYHLKMIIEKLMVDGNNKTIMIGNFGSGSANDTTETLSLIKSENEELFSKIRVYCVDIDSEALRSAEEFAKEKEVIQQVEFVNSNFLFYPHKVKLDIVLLIGILCPLSHETCSVILERIKRFIIEGGYLIVSNVTPEMQKRERFFSNVVLGEIINWKLMYKTPDEIKKLLEKAGYEEISVFYDEPLRFHGMTIARKIPVPMK